MLGRLYRKLGVQTRIGVAVAVFREAMRIVAEDHGISEQHPLAATNRSGISNPNNSKGKVMYNVGEKPGKGTYCCTDCDWKVTLDDDSDQLPPCGNCGKGQNTKYEKC